MNEAYDACTPFNGAGVRSFQEGLAHCLAHAAASGHEIGVHRPTHGYVSTVPAVLSTRMGWKGIIKAQGEWTTSGFEF